MTTRRGFFGMLAGLAAAPWIPKFESKYAGPTEGHNYTFHYRNFICDDVVSSQNAMTAAEAKQLWEHYNRIFVWTYTPGTLYWSKELSE